MPPYAPPRAVVAAAGTSSSKEFHAWQFGQRPSGLALVYPQLVQT